MKVSRNVSTSFQAAEHLKNLAHLQRESHQHFPLDLCICLIHLYSALTMCQALKALHINLLI